MRNRFAVKTNSLSLAFILLIMMGFIGCSHGGVIKTGSPAQPSSYKKPVVVEGSLENGLRYYLISSTELPIVKMQVWIRSGLLCEPEAQTGLCSVLSESLVTGGNSLYGATETVDWLEQHGARIQVSASEQSINLSGFFLKEDIVEAMKLMAAVIQTPKFDEHAVDLAKEKARVAVDQRFDDVDGLSWQLFYRLLYGPSHVTGRLSTHSTIDAVSRDSLLQFQAEWFHPRFIQFGIFGDFDQAQVTPILQQLWSQWKPSTQPVFPEIQSGKHGMTPGLYLLDMPDQEQSTIIFGHESISMKDPEYPASLLLDYHTGFGWSSVLTNEVREKRGLAYTVYGGHWSQYGRPGEFMVYCKTKTETTTEALSLMIEELQKIRTNKLPEPTVAQLREIYDNHYVFNFRDEASVLSRIMTYGFFGYPSDFYEQEYKQCMQLTAEQIFEATQRLIDPKRYVILITGNSAKLTLPESFGPVRRIDHETLLPVHTSAPQ